MDFSGYCFSYDGLVSKAIHFRQTHQKTSLENYLTIVYLCIYLLHNFSISVLLTPYILVVIHRLQNYLGQTYDHVLLTP